MRDDIAFDERAVSATEHVDPAHVSQLRRPNVMDVVARHHGASRARRLLPARGAGHVSSCGYGCGSSAAGPRGERGDTWLYPHSHPSETPV